MKIPHLLLLYCFAFSIAQFLPSFGQVVEQNFVPDTKSSVLKVDCDKRNKCVCEWSPDRTQYLIKCSTKGSAKNNLITTSLSESHINIHCHGTIEFDVKLFPTLNATNITTIQIVQCPLSKQSYGNLVKMFNMTEIARFQMDHMNLNRSKNKILTKSNFKGLERAQEVFVRNNSGFLEIDEDAFAPLLNMQLLNMHHNTLELKPKMFRNNVNLKKIDLSFNKLEVIPGNIFANLSSLHWLSLHGNKLKKLDELTFAGLHNLENLTLSSNEIEVISGRAFEPLVKLSELNMTSNKVTILPQNVFSKNAKLLTLRLDGNPGLVLSDDVFANLPSLTHLGLTRCNLTKLPEHVFDATTSLVKLELSGNQIAELPEKVFSRLIMLTELRLDDNRMEVVPNFGILNHLWVLDLSRNRITNIGDKAFKGLINLRSLNLANNNVAIHQNALEHVSALSDVFLNNNSLTTFDCDIFARNTRLKRIHVRDNLLTEFPKGCFYGQPHLALLDLANNSLSELEFSELHSVISPLTIDLRHNNISAVHFTHFYDYFKDAWFTKGVKGVQQTVSHILLHNNPITCDCFALPLNHYLYKRIADKLKNMLRVEGATCGNPQKLRGRLFPAPFKAMFCPYEEIVEAFKCPNECNSCHYYPDKDSLVYDCNNRNLKQYPEIIHPTYKAYSFTTFHFENNSLEKGPESTWSGWNGIKELNLDKNRIQDIPWIPQNGLQILSLRHNKLTTISDEVLEQIGNSSLKTLNLKFNPWSCKCPSIELFKFVLLHKQLINPDEILCTGTNVRLTELNLYKICREKWSWKTYLAYYVILPMLLIAVAAIISAVRKNKKFMRPIQEWLYSHRFLRGLVNHEDIEYYNKPYDVFLSFSQLDYYDVVEEMLIRIESGRAGLRACIHIRDWVAGEYIVDLIHESIRESRKTIIVLSQNFLTSVWGKLELKMAYTKAFERNRKRLIIVLLDNVDVDQLDAEFKAYLKSATCLKWSDNTRFTDYNPFYAALKKALHDY